MNVNAIDWTALLPLTILAAAPVVIMLTAAFRRNHGAALLITLAGLALSGAAAIRLAGPTARPVTALLTLDATAAVFIGLLLAATGFTAVLAHGYLSRFAGNREEFYILLLLAALGAAVLASSTHFASLFLGFEILSISLYALIAYPRLSVRHIEAGVKYLILAAASSAFMLFGLALLYAFSGSMELARIGALLRGAESGGGRTLLMTGAGMLLVGLAFKMAVVPFHWWTPDVYQGAPMPVTGFVATVSKGGVVALLVRLFAPLSTPPGGSLFILLAAMAIASMIVGNLLALLQNNVKRILAYSSIAHLGYLLTAFLSGGRMAAPATIFYLAAYFITTLGAFGVLTVLSSPDREAETIDDLRGLFHTRPWLGGVLAAMLFSLAGMPLTAGFLGKVYITAAAVGTGRWLLITVLVVTSTIGLYYYLRVISAMFAQAPEAVEAAPEARPEREFPPATVPAAGVAALALLSVLLIWLGIAPSPLLSILQGF